MTRSLFGKSAAFAGLFLLVLSGVAFACLNIVPPFAAIEYNASEAVSLHGRALAFDKAHPVYLVDLAASDASHWLDSTVTQLTTLRGYAHMGIAGMTQQEANRNVLLIQIWGWRDTNGNGAADAKDTTTQWTKLSELTPSAIDGDGSGGNVVGWGISYPPTPAITTSTWQGDILQGHTITLKPGESWLLLIRVVDISGNTNLMAQVGGVEKWDSGIVDGPGSGVAADRYVDCHGNTPGTTDARIKDQHVVWVYVARLR
jgi:hypothetical protein